MRHASTWPQTVAMWQTVATNSQKRLLGPSSPSAAAVLHEQP